MPYADKEKKREYDRERMRRIREKEVEKEVDSGNLNFGLKPESIVKPDNEPEKLEALGANAFHAEVEDKPRKPNQQKLREMFGNKAE